MVVVAIIAILAAMLLPALSRAKASGGRTLCLSNLKQIATGVHLYTDDFNDVLFPITNTSSNFVVNEWTAYNPLMRSYVGLKAAPSPRDKLFACPADTFSDWSPDGAMRFVSQSIHLLSRSSYSSYAFNAGNAVFQIPAPRFPGMFPGIMGSNSSSINLPDKTVLVAEFPALDSYSWHRPSPPDQRYYNNAPDMISFADGHVNYVRMCLGSNNPSHSLQHPFIFNPPDGYDYNWSGN
jgi:type II secretory pathway pseudopilin PulG